MRSCRRSRRETCWSASEQVTGQLCPHTEARPTSHNATSPSLLTPVWILLIPADLAPLPHLQSLLPAPGNPSQRQNVCARNLTWLHSYTAAQPRLLSLISMCTWPDFPTK